VDLLGGPPADVTAACRRTSSRRMTRGGRGSCAGIAHQPIGDRQCEALQEREEVDVDVEPFALETGAEAAG